MCTPMQLPQPTEHWMQQHSDYPDKISIVLLTDLVYLYGPCCQNKENNLHFFLFFFLTLAIREKCHCIHFFIFILIPSNCKLLLISFQIHIQFLFKSTSIYNRSVINFIWTFNETEHTEPCNVIFIFFTKMSSTLDKTGIAILATMATTQ